MENETRGQEDAAQDAAACAEALESLDRFSLDEVAFDETIVDMQDAAGDGIPDTGDDVRMLAMKPMSKKAMTRAMANRNPTRR